jgi:hypothetical protein
MATLTEAAKRFIVQALECYDRPTQVAEAVKEEFGIDVHRAHVAMYDPSKAAGAKLAGKWKVLFEDTRKRFREEAAEIPIASQAYRLRTLQRMLAKVEERGNIAMAAQLLEQAAKEVGDVFVNRRLDAPKAPGTEEAMPAAEYILSPDEHVPERPIL